MNSRILIALALTVVTGAAFSAIVVRYTNSDRPTFAWGWPEGTEGRPAPNGYDLEIIHMLEGVPTVEVIRNPKAMEWPEYIGDRTTLLARVRVKGEDDDSWSLWSDPWRKHNLTAWPQPTMVTLDDGTEVLVAAPEPSFGVLIGSGLVGLMLLARGRQ